MVLQCRYTIYSVNTPLYGLEDLRTPAVHRGHAYALKAVPNREYPAVGAWWDCGRTLVDCGESGRTWENGGGTLGEWWKVFDYSLSTPQWPRDLDRKKLWGTLPNWAKMLQNPARIHQFFNDSVTFTPHLSTLEIALDSVLVYNYCMQSSIYCVCIGTLAH